MTDTLEIFGKEYTGVTGIVAKDNNDADKTYIRPQGTKSITANGNNIDVAEYATANVSVSPTLQTKSKSYTPSETAQSEDVTPGTGYDGLSKVSVSVGAISSTYVGSGIARKSSTDLTANGATITAPAGYYESSASKAVASGTAGTPTASKGTVSNHAVSVTPSVTNTTGYITGSTKTGTAVSVSASELVSGTKSITGSGNTDVTNYASASVASGSATTPATTVTANPSISVSEGGLITASASATKSVTPTVSAGWVASGTAGTITISGSNTSQLTTQGAQTITPTATAQTIASGKCLTGTQTVEGIVCENLTASNIKSGVVVKVGTATDDDSVTTVTGTFVGGGVTQDEEGFLVVPTEGGGGGGGSGEPVTQKQITFIDYDGTLLYSYTPTEWRDVTALPPNPSHSGLTAQGWNWTKNQIDAQLTAMPTGDIIVGQNYVTQSGDSEIDVEFTDPLILSPYLSIAVNGTVTVDWGDNSTADTVTGTSLTTRKTDIHHTYTSTGSYTIKIHVVSGSFAFYATTTNPLLHGNYNGTNSRNTAYAITVKVVRIGNDAVLGNYGFVYCRGLKSVTIPNTITSVGASIFNYCYSLISVVIPYGVTTLSSSMTSGCYSVKFASIPSSITSFGSSVFSSCYSLISFTIPSGITSLGSSFFNSCYTLKRIVLPSGITTLPANTFSNCYCITEVTTLGTITNITGVSAFSSCYVLSKCVSPTTATSIPTSTYSSCYAMTTATIPSTVTSIGDSAYRYCYSLLELHVKPTTPPTLGTNVFGSLPSDCVIYVPTAKLADYQVADGWSTLASQMQGE